MQNIHEILKAYALEIPADKKASFDKAVAENYKTIAEVNKLNEKLARANEDLTATKGSLDTMTAEFDALKESNASADDFKKKYDDLVAENNRREKERNAASIEAQERAEFDKYFADNKKEWNNPFIADGYFAKFKEAKEQDANKGRMLADILHDLTKDDSTAFKGVQAEVNLGGAKSIGGGANRMAELYKNNPFFKG